MKIIFSRKGFDSATGGIPSPVLDDGTMVSLPIPSDVGPTRFCDVQTGLGTTYSRVLRDLNWPRKRFCRGWRRGGAVCHLDPDLSSHAITRQPGWRPAFGQIGVGQTQLTPSGVGPGDLFLFFGWCRLAERVRARISYVPGTKPFHALFGWLEVGEVFTLDSEAERAHAISCHPWLSDHPHVCDADYWAKRICRNGSNCIYVSSMGPDGPNAGMFRFDHSLRLTAQGKTASQWAAPDWLIHGGNSHLSRCNDPGRLDADARILDTHAGRWQEMVLDSNDYPDSRAGHGVGSRPGAETWARTLIARARC